MDIDGNATKMEVEKCDDAAGVTVTTKKLKATIKKLKKGKRYFIRVQAYKIENGKKVFGAYSKKVRTKKIQ